jgi:hypothetical protein
MLGEFNFLLSIKKKKKNYRKLCKESKVGYERLNMQRDLILFLEYTKVPVPSSELAPPPSFPPASVPPPPPPGPKGGGATHACRCGGGGGQFGRREKAWHP